MTASATATAPAPARALTGGQSCDACRVQDQPAAPVLMARATVAISVRRGYEPTPVWLCADAMACCDRMRRQGVLR